MASSSNILVSGQFYDGYVYKKLIETLGGSISQGNIIFKEDIWYLCELDSNESLMIFLVIRTDELINYQYNHSEPELMVGVDFESFHRHSKSIGKKNSVEFQVKRDDAGQIVMALHSENMTSSIIYPINVIREKVEIPTYNQNRKPILIKGGEFSKICSSMGQLPNLSEDMIVISAYDRGFKIEAFESTGESLKTKDFGSLSTAEENILERDETTGEYSSILSCENLTYISEDSAKDGVICRFAIEKSRIKALARLDSLSHMGLIKFIFEKDRPMKMMCQVGSYGTIQIFVKNALNTT
uniref:Proliferating cell nuclear antigen n=1 Tax=Pithovirus LCPAC404 TaxID=2506597 RepID=A0A481ZCR3_9VIRU|nr:MAG: proliferating cell nuclear antigen [Pithovirus LCPAC404]